VHTFRFILRLFRPVHAAQEMKKKKTFAFSQNAIEEKSANESEKKSQ
jgi:hypothetical protein